MITFKNLPTFYNHLTIFVHSVAVSSFLHSELQLICSGRLTSVLLNGELRGAHEGVSGSESGMLFSAGTSYLKTTLNNFPPSRSASHEFLMTAILRLSQLSMA